MDCSMVQMVVNHGRGEGLWDAVWCKHVPMDHGCRIPSKLAFISVRAAAKTPGNVRN